MKQIMGLVAFLVLADCGGVGLAQSDAVVDQPLIAHAILVPSQQDSKSPAEALDTQRERDALRVFLKSLQERIVPAAGAMPADKYRFAPTDGEFKGVRTFGQQVKHLAATNYILAAAALGGRTAVFRWR
ncbi:MAG: hypothetical protein QOE55_3038 [Acidobacteriaceae bacterium]|nr:hypothetical protein [Acidobacteriaceae bacterium]